MVIYCGNLGSIHSRHHDSETLVITLLSKRSQNLIASFDFDSDSRWPTLESHIHSCPCNESRIHSFRGGGSGEAVEAAASPDFRGWLTNFLGKKCENRGIFIAASPEILLFLHPCIHSIAISKYLIPNAYESWAEPDQNLLL